MAQLSPVCITDYSFCTPLGDSRVEVARRLYGGETGLTEPPFELPFRTQAGVLPFALPPVPDDLSLYDGRPTRMAAHLVLQMEDTLRRARERWGESRIGVVLGTSTGCALATEQAYDHYLERGQLPPEFNFRQQHGYASIADVAKRMAGFTGPSWVISTTCTSSAKPLGSALRLINSGILDAVLVGGVDTLCRVTLTGFQSLEALSPVRCRPFSAERQGINIGEGGAFLLVERKGEARALLEGVGETSDAYHISAPHPQGLGAKLALEEALRQAGKKGADVDVVNAHGTGTALNDVAEGQALFEVLGPDVPVASTKGYTGHALGGAGAMEAVFSIMTLEDGILPPSLGADPLEPKLRINVSSRAQEGDYRRIMSNSFAFGGNNACVLLRKA